MTDQNGRLIISEEDLLEVPAAPALPGAAPPPTHAGQFPPSMGAKPIASAAPPPTGQPSYPSVAGVKPPPLTIGSATGSVAPTGLAGMSTLATNLVAGLACMLPAWAISELFTNPDAVGTSESELVGQVALWVGVLGVVFGALFSSWDKLTARAWEGALPQAGVGAVVGGIAGAISGAIAQSTYHSILVDIAHDPSGASGPNDARFYLARGLAWAIFGLSIGAACAAAQRTARKLINASLGGLVGGAVGGLFFQWLDSSGTVHDGTVARFLALVVIGGAIGAAIGLIETARRQAWLKIVGGGMKGKEFIVYHEHANVGSSPKCEITLIKDPAIGAHHFRIDDQAGRRSLAVYEGCPTTVNGHPVTSHMLRDGDVIQVGSTSIRYSERAVAQ